MGPVVLYVDGDAARRAATVSSLADAGLAVREAATVVGAERILDEGDLECVVAKYDLPDGTGVDLFDRVRRLAPDAACVLFSSVDLAEIDPPGAGEPIIENVDAGHPDALDRLRERVREAVTRRRHAAYPVPPAEPARLAAVDAARPFRTGPGLDRLVATAADALSAPAAGVGVVEAHHERFLATTGVDWDEFDRQDTVCTYAICDPGVTVVEDLTADPRFSRSQPLLDSGLRAYAGAPIADPRGHAVGVLCVFDQRPRRFTAGERAALRRLADEAAARLGLDGASRANA